MKNKTIICSLAVMSVLMLGSCKKDDDSSYQPKGNYGNANIATSNTVLLNNWSVLTDDGTNFEYKSAVTWPEITSSVVSNGMVMVYAQDSNGWDALPFSETQSGISLSFNYSYFPGSVEIDCDGYSSSGSPGTGSLDSDGIVVKIVAISSAGRKANPNLDYRDYNAVKKAFNIKD